MLSVVVEVGVREEGKGERGIGARRSQVAVEHGFGNNLECLGAARLFKVRGHTANGIELQVGAAAAAQLFRCFKGIFKGVRAWCLDEVKRWALGVCQPWALSLRWWEMKGQFKGGIHLEMWLRSWIHAWSLSWRRVGWWWFC